MRVVASQRNNERYAIRDSDWLTGSLAHWLTGSLVNVYASSVQRLIFTLVYYWYNLMPLTRGTAGVGFAVVSGLLLASGYEFTTGLPDGVQLDWEALLESDYEVFAERMVSVVQPLLRESAAVLERMPSVRETLPTVEHVIEALIYEHAHEPKVLLSSEELS